jgi:hypothetical protein
MSARMVSRWMDGRSFKRPVIVSIGSIGLLDRLPKGRIMPLVQGGNKSELGSGRK